MDTEMDKMKRGFNKVVQEFQETVDAMIDTSNNEIQDRIKTMENAIATATQRLKDQEDTNTFLK
jgi:hypothetical protein